MFSQPASSLAGSRSEIGADPTIADLGIVTPMLTHTLRWEDIQKAYTLFGERRENVIKVASRP